MMSSMKEFFMFVMLLGLIPNVNSVAVSDGDIEITNGAYDKFIRRTTGYDVFELSTDITIEDGFTIEVPEGYILTIRVDTGDEISRSYSELPLFTVYGTLILEGVIVTSASAGGGAVRVYTGGTLISRKTVYTSCEAVKGNGGAIYNSGDMNLTEVTFTSCTASHVNGTGGYGGAIYNTQGGSVMINGMAVDSCVGRYGGAVANNGTGALSMTKGVFSENNGTVSGGDFQLTGFGSVVTIAHSTFSLSHAGSMGGSISMQGSCTMVIKSSLFSLTSAKTRGGCLAASDDAVISFRDVHVLDASMADETAALGGNLFLSDDVTFDAFNTTFASTESGSLILPELPNSGVNRGRCVSGKGTGCGRGVYRGGGLYLKDRAQCKLADVSCIALSSSDAGACIYATDDVKLDFAMGYVNSSVNTSRAISLVSLTETSSFSKINFAENTGSLYIEGSPVEMTSCSFTQDVAPSELSSGGSIYITDGATLTAANITATSNTAMIDGGWLFAEASTVTLDSLVAFNNYANGKGGVLFVDSMYEVIITDLDMQNNSAKAGGVLFARACSYPDPFMDHDLYKGVQLHNGLIQYNHAREGGALYGEDSVLYANNIQFIQNYGIGDGVRGTTSIFTPDAIYVRTTITSDFADSIPRYENTTVLEGERLVFDSSSFTYPESGIAIKLWNESTNVGEGYTLLNRNSDLSLIRDNEDDARWDYVRCLAANTDDNSNDGIATNNYPMDYNEAIREMPSLVSMGLDYDPVCPSDATCTNVPATKSISCTCPSGSSFTTINNKLSQCQTYVPSPAPSLAPSIAKVNTPLPTVSPKIILANYTMASNPLVGMESIQNLESEIRVFGYVLLSIIGIAFLTSCLVDLRSFIGMSQSEKQILLLTVMYNFPSTFHRILCLERDPVIEMLNVAEHKEDQKEKAKFLRRSISLSSNDEGNFFRGGSFDNDFFAPNKQSMSFEPGYGFDFNPNASFDFKSSSFAPGPVKAPSMKADDIQNTAPSGGDVELSKMNDDGPDNRSVTL